MKKRKFISIFVLFVIGVIVFVNLYLIEYLPSLLPSNRSNGVYLAEKNSSNIHPSDSNEVVGLFAQDIRQNESDFELFPSISFNPVMFGRSDGSRSHGEYAVTFLTSDGQILEDRMVGYGERVELPQNPKVLPGEVFVGWDPEPDKITDDIIIKEETINVSEIENAIALSTGYCHKGETATLSLQLCGKVCLSGVDLSIRFDPQKLEFKEFSYEDDAVICNYDNKTGEIKLNFLTLRNVQGDVELCNMIFKAIGKAEKIPLSITVKEILAFDGDDELYVPEYRIIDGAVWIIK